MVLLFIYRYNPERDGYEELIERHLNIAAVCMGQQSTGGVPMWKHDVVIVTAGQLSKVRDKNIFQTCRNKSIFTVKDRICLQKDPNSF